MDASEASAASEPRYQSGGIVSTPERFVLDEGEDLGPVRRAEAGSRQFMEIIAAGRHPGVVSLMRHLSYAHLPAKIRLVVEPFSHLARTMIDMLPDSPELTESLRKLVEAKDCAARARVDALDV